VWRAVLLGVRGSAGISGVLPALREGAAGRRRADEVRIVRASLTAGVEQFP
jgi:hypothetical protein